MSTSFSMDSILKRDNYNEGLYIDLNYPSGSVYLKPQNNDLVEYPKLCFSEHPFCRKIGAPGFHDGRFFLCNDVSKRFIWRIPPIIDPRNSSPVDSALISNISTRVCTNKLAEITNPVQEHGALPNLCNVSKSFPVQIQSNPIEFPEMVQNIAQYGIVKNVERFPKSQRTGSVAMTDINPSAPQKISKLYTVQNSDRFLGSSRSNLVRTSDANHNSFLTSLGKATSSSKSISMQIPNSSDTCSMQVTKSPKEDLEQDINSTEILLEKIKRLPEKAQDISKNRYIEKIDIFSEWGKHILQKHLELSPNNSRIFPETFLNIPRANPAPLQNAFPGWFSQQPTTLGGTDAKEVQVESSTRSKRKRTTFTSSQLIHLEKIYTLENKYLTRLQRIELSSELGLTEKQVKVWFQNRRVRDKPRDDNKPYKYMRGRKIKCEDVEVKNETPNNLSNDPSRSSPPAVLS